jgi:hypothetical protein
VHRELHRGREPGDVLAPVRDEADLRVVVVQEPHGQAVPVIAAADVVRDRPDEALRDLALRLPCVHPRPLADVVGPVVGGVEAVGHVVGIARRGLREQQEVGLHALHLTPPLRPEVGPAVADRPGGVDAEPVHVELAHPVRHRLRDVRAHLRVRVVQVREVVVVEEVGVVALLDVRVGGRVQRILRELPLVEAPVARPLSALQPIDEVRVLDRAVVGHVVEDDAHAAPVRLGDQAPQILLRAELLLDPEVVRDRVFLADRGRHNRRQPQQVHAQLLQVVQPARDRLERRRAEEERQHAVADGVPDPLRLGRVVVGDGRLAVLDHEVVGRRVRRAALVGGGQRDVVLAVA